MRISFSIIAVFFLLSCVNNKNNEDIHYPEEKVIAVMVDLYIAQAAIKDVDKSYTDSLISDYKAKIERIHDVDIALIEADIAQLQKQPATYKKLHEIVEDSIVALEKAYNEKKEIKIAKSR